MNIEMMVEILVEVLGVNEETINVVSKINGYNEKTMKDILYVVAGYEDFEQFEEYEM